jgi:hypothetical protein
MRLPDAAANYTNLTGKRFGPIPPPHTPAEPPLALDIHIRVPTRLWREGVMALNITKSRVDGVTVIHLSSAIIFGGESKSLFIHTKDLLSKAPQIVLDLSEVTRIDSGGFGALVALYASA